MRDILTASISRMPWKLWNRWLISWTTLFRVLANWLTIPKCDGVSKNGKSTALNSYIGKGLKRLWFACLKHAYDINSKSRSDVHEFFSLSSLLFFLCNIIFGNCPPPPPPKKKKTGTSLSTSLREWRWQRSLHFESRLRGNKRNSVFHFVGKNLLLIEKDKCGHTLTRWILFSRCNFKLRFFEGYSG